MQAVRDGELPRLIINAPPRMGKSMLCSILYHPWVWASGFPSAEFLFTSFKTDLSDDFSLKSQKVVFSDWYTRHFGHVVKFDKTCRQTINVYENAAQGVRRCGAFASVTGAGASGPQSCCLVDDPHSTTEVLSDPVRQKDLEQFDSGISTRIQNSASLVIVMQVLHTNDLTGHLLERGGYQHLCLANEFESDRRSKTVGLNSFKWSDPRTHDGELIWPEVVTAEKTEQIKLDLKHNYYGQYQQRAIQREGGLLKRDWFKFWSPSQLPEKWDEELISCDFSFKDGKKADYNCLQVWKRSGPNFYLIDQVRRQMDFVTTVQAFKALCDKHPSVSAKLIEDKANGPAVISAIRDQIGGIISITPRDSKEARVSAISGYIEAGNVLLPDDAPWKDHFLVEVTNFPLFRTDDCVDAMSQALLRFDKTRKRSGIALIQHSVL